MIQIWPCHSLAKMLLPSWWSSNSFTQQTSLVVKFPREPQRSHWNSLQSGSHLLRTNGAALNVFSDSTCQCQISSRFSSLKVSGSFYTVDALPVDFFSTLIPRNHTWFPPSSLDAPSHYPRIQSLNLFFSLFMLIPTSPFGNKALNTMSTIRSLKCDPPALTSILNFRIKFPIT